MDFQPIIIIGAGRSGTNILRDCLTSLPGLSTWPCDEINYIWRHGNLGYPSDEFTQNMARPRVQRYIRQKFAWVARRYDSEVVVEKTCANSLRVEFVDHIFPEAKYIFIRRNGFDVVCSALKRWQAKLDLGYLAKKARFVPLMDLPYYVFLYLWNRIYRLASKQKRLAFWGPKLDNMDSLLKNHSLEEVCALQWKRCIDRSIEALISLSSNRWVEVAYEDFVQSPRLELERILTSLGFKAESLALDQAVDKVSKASLGKGRSELKESQIHRLEPLISDTLKKYGYV